MLSLKTISAVCFLCIVLHATMTSIDCDGAGGGGGWGGGGGNRYLNFFLSE